MPLFLYHHNSSVCAAKVRVSLAEKKISWEGSLLRLDGDQLQPAYVKLNPNSVVPTLVHEGRRIIESNVILEYLEDAFPDPPLRPASAFDRAQARLLMMQLDDDASGIHFAASVATYAIGRRHGLIAKAGSADRDRLDRVLKESMNLKSREWLRDAVFLGIEAPVFRAALLRLERMMAEFELRLAASDWLAGDSFSIADVAYMPYMFRLELLQMDCLWFRRPAVTAWYRRTKERDSFAAITDWYNPKNIETLTRRGREAADRAAGMLRQTRQD